MIETATKEIINKRRCIMFHKWQVTIRNHGVFAFEGCNNFERGDFFLRSADGDLVSSDSFAAGMCRVLAAGEGEDCTSVCSCFVQLR